MSTKQLKPVEWLMMDAGWYIAQRDGEDLGIGICREGDRKWHVYVGKYDAPGHSHSRWITLAYAKKAALRTRIRRR
jgi:hypothetical protein